MKGFLKGFFEKVSNDIYMKNNIKRETRKKMNRSGTQICPICDLQAPLEEHHIGGRDIPEPNHPSNLCSICPTCHTKVHMGEILIEGWLRTTEGLQLFWHDKAVESFSGRNVETYTY